MFKNFFSKKEVSSTIGLAYSYKICRDITKAKAKNFYYCFQVLPNDLKKSIYALYAFCRYCDDIADGNTSQANKIKSLNLVKKHLNTSSNQEDIYPALFDSIEKFSIPIKYFFTLIEGLEMDIKMNSEFSEYKSINDLLKYCYKVSSIVGLMCIEVFGYKSKKANFYAIQLGYAMQITNITRDIFEDMKIGRIYIPKEDFSSCNYSINELKNYSINENYTKMVKLQIIRAREFFLESQKLLPLIPKRSRLCISALIEIYSKLLDLIEKNNYDLTSARIKLSQKEKIIFMLKYYFTYSYYQLFSSD